MKICPRCGKQFPDIELFCETDGTALVASGGQTAGPRVTTVMPPAPGQTAEAEPIECPRCGGKAQPGELICNFCGAQLAPAPPPSQPSFTPPPPTGTRVTLENFSPAQERPGPREMGTEAPLPPEGLEEQNGGRRILSVLGFSIAAILALIGGAWFALYLSGKHHAAPVAKETASPSPAAVASPTVDLAKTISIQVAGDLAGTMFRDEDSMRKVFDSDKAGLLDAYRHELASDSTLRDGMILRLHIVADGSVSQSTILTSTAPNPSLDAAVVSATSRWKFASASSTGVDADFPIIFTTNPADVAGIESNLNTKLASLGPSTTPEYPPSAVTAATPAATATPSPAVAAVPSEVAPIPTPAPRRHRPPAVVASVPKPPKISLLTRVNEQLAADRKLRRVHAFTTGGTVTLSGKVFDDNDKLLAERTVRHVSGVTGVVNDLTTDTQEWAQNQARIQQELQNAGLTGVTVKVIGNSAYLSGEVKTDLERQRAVTIAESAAPVKVRENLIRVAIGSIFGP